MDILIVAIFMVFIILPMLGLGVIGLYLWYAEQTRKRCELEAGRAKEREEKRQRLIAFLRSEMDSMREAVAQFSRSMDCQTGYFSNYQLGVWRDSGARIWAEIKDRKLEGLERDSQELQTVTTFVSDYRNAETIRADFNRRFVVQELNAYARFFDECLEGKSLDLQQRTAVVTDEDNNLAIAGAGTGKTTTILGKVNYVVDRYVVDPREILLISFTRKSAKDLERRLTIPGIEVKTFRRFGKDVIQAVEGQPPSIFDEEQFQPLLTRFFKELIQDPDYLGQVTEYFTDFLKRPKSPFAFQSQGDYIQ